MNRRDRGRRPDGQIRQSQLLTSFGPGAMLDLPDHSVLVGGLDHWRGMGQRIDERRLVDKLKEQFKPALQSLDLLPPPPATDGEEMSKSRVVVWQFPEWFITQNADPERSRGVVRARQLVHQRQLQSGKFVDERRKKVPVVPIRFVRACINGHIGDIDWKTFAHGGPSDCLRSLWIEERGTTGDLSEVWVRCDCGQAERSMLEASTLAGRALGYCDGNRPWLGNASRESCGELNRLLIRTASNAYFAQSMSVISLPDHNEKIRSAVEAVWDFVSEVEDLDDVAHERKKAKVRSALDGFSDEEVFEEIENRRKPSQDDSPSVKVVEMKTLAASPEGDGNDQPDGTFFARGLPRSGWDKPWMKDIEQVVLVHRLREVIAQVGFTRFEPVSTDIEGELEVGVGRASLSRDADIGWLPAVENWGEGIFLQFNREAIEEWAKRPDVLRRGETLEHGFRNWQQEHSGSKRKFFGLPYIMLHSFSHLLVTAVSLECGYPASSIRERIYGSPENGYGILLFTASSDAEGTLGGLIETGRRIHEHVQKALRLGELCSNDPVCAQHQPASEQERRFLHGAACHGCLLISETSCEQHNDYLDRALVVPTVDDCGAEFFQAAAE